MTMIAQKIRDSKVEIAAPATPMPTPQIRIALPKMFMKFEITEMIIGQRVLFWARKMEAPAS